MTGLLRWGPIALIVLLAGLVWWLWRDGQDLAGELAVERLTVEQLKRDALAAAEQAAIDQDVIRRAGDRAAARAREAASIESAIHEAATADACRPGPAVRAALRGLRGTYRSPVPAGGSAADGPAPAAGGAVSARP